MNQNTMKVLKMEIDGKDIQPKGTRIKSPVSSKNVMHTTSVLFPTEGTHVNPHSYIKTHVMKTRSGGTMSEDIPKQDAEQCSVSTNVKRNKKAWTCRKRKNERNDSSSSLCVKQMKVGELSFRNEVKETSETPLNQKEEVYPLNDSSVLGKTAIVYPVAKHEKIHQMKTRHDTKGTVAQGDIHHSHSIENQGAVFNTAATQKEESTTCTVSRNEKQCVPNQGIRRKRSQTQKKFLKSTFDGKPNRTSYPKNEDQLSLDMKEMPSKELLVNAEKDPTSALMALATNSGLGRFLDSSQLIREWRLIEPNTVLNEEEEMPGYITNLIAELSKNVTLTDYGRIFQEFQNHWNLTADLVACASCGMKSYQMGEDSHHKVALEEVNCVQMSKENVQTLETYPQEYRAVISFYKSTSGNFFHLHPEFVTSEIDEEGNATEFITLCHECYISAVKMKKIPKNSIAAGVDYGNSNRVRELQSLTIAEQYVISRGRLLVSIIKLSGQYAEERQSGKIGHVVVFPQEGKGLEEELRRCLRPNGTEIFPRHEELEKSLSVSFVGTRQQWDALVPNPSSRCFRDILVRPDVVYKWLYVLKIFSPYYKDVLIHDTPEIRKKLEDIPEVLLKHATIITGESEIFIDRIIGKESGAEKVNETKNEHGTNAQKCNTNQGTIFSENINSTSTSLVTRACRPNTGTSITSTTILEGLIASVDGSTAETEESEIVANEFQSGNTVKFIQSEKPFNEFQENDTLLYTAFPHLFLLGKGLGTRSSLPRKSVVHLLMQYHGHFATCLRFIFLLFDQHQRHSATRIIAARVKSNPESIAKFATLVSGPSFLEKLKYAKNHPNEAESKTILNTINPLITMCNSEVPYTTAQRKASVSRLYNMTRFYGTPSVFFTFAPDDTNGTLILRMALPLADNFTFPAKDSGFIDALQKNQHNFENVPISQASLRKILASGPVAAAEMFRQTVNNVFSIIMGLQADNSSKKKDIPLCGKQSGAFGLPVAAFGCTEEQARGSLHMHIVFWGGLPPTLLQAAGGIHLLADAIARAINIIVKAELQPITHFNHLLRDLKNETVPHASLFVPHHPIKQTQLFETDVERTVDLCNVHQHTTTCTKGKTGMYSCRLGRPMDIEEETECKQIIGCEKKSLDQSEKDQPGGTSKEKEKPLEKGEKKNIEKTYNVLPNIEAPPLSSSFKRNFSTTPIPTRDTRLIIYGLKRRESGQVEDLDLTMQQQQLYATLSKDEKQRLNSTLLKRNGMVVEFNPLIAALLGCNTNVSVLGSDAQAKAALSYLIKYVTKPPAELAHSLSLFYHARKAIQHRPSIAADQGTTQRTSMHYLNKIINKLNGAVEISAPMAAAALLGMPSETCTDSFWITYVTASVKYIRGHPESPSLPKISDETQFEDISEYFQSDGEIEQDVIENNVEEMDVLSNEDQWETNSSVSDNTNDCDTLTDLTIRETRDPDITDADETDPIPLTIQETDENIISTAEIYVSQKNVKAVPQHVHYAYRGEKLAMLSLYEYVALINIIPISPKKRQDGVATEETMMKGRHPNAVFLFESSHPLHGTHQQRLRSKYKIPMLVGKPPNMPVSKPKILTNEWKKLAQKFAEYFLVLYKPWSVPTEDGGTLPGPTTWQTLCQYMYEIEAIDQASKPSFLNTIRAKWITNAAHGLRISASDRVAAQKYRCRAATVWKESGGISNLKKTLSNEERLSESRAQNQEEMNAAREAQEAIDIMRQEARQDEDTQQTTNLALKYYRETEGALKKIFELTSDFEFGDSPNKKKNTELVCKNSNEDESIISAIMDNLRKENNFSPVAEDERTDPLLTPSTMDNSIPNEKPSKLSDKLNKSQRAIWIKVQSYFQMLRKYKDGFGTKPTPIHLLVHGGPGTGKSFLAKCIYEVALKYQFTIGCIAPTGIAASNLPNGRTAHNFCGIPITHCKDAYLEKPSPTNLSALQNRVQHTTLALLLIDEISNLGPVMFGHIENRMRHIMENDELYGGLAVIAMGDFFQLPPVRPAETLYSAALKWLEEKQHMNRNHSLSGPRCNGIRIFTTFEKIELMEQMRAAEDPNHTEFIKTLRTTSEKSKTLTKEWLGSIKTLKTEDVQNDKSWTGATVVVTSNEERCRINEQQSKAMATMKKSPRILWDKPMEGIVANRLTTEDTNYIYQNYKQFTGVFVPGAPAFLTENINPHRGLSNGTPVTLHSLILDPEEDLSDVIERLADKSGNDVRLKYNPIYILVKIKNADPNDFIGLTVIPGEAIIPIGMTTESKEVSVQIPLKKSFKLKAKKIHGLELGFAITFHKIQGQTCDKLIVDLNKRPFQPQVTFATFYVAVSRVRRSIDLKLMPLHPEQRDFNHLLSLHPSPELLKWLQGYSTNGMWDPKLIKVSEDQSTNHQQKNTKEPNKRKRVNPRKEDTNPTEKKRKLNKKKHS